MIVVLDSGPLGMITNPRAGGICDECRSWMDRLVSRGVAFAIPEIADYEVRRELLRLSRAAGLRRLDLLARETRYLPITTAVMRRAAEYWARARRQGRPAAHDKALDGDVILAAQASLLRDGGKEVVIATTNVAHLEAFAPANIWSEIP